MITTKTANYFESKVRVERITEDGMQVKMNELYVVKSMSFSETEAKITDYLSKDSCEEFVVLTEVRAKYREIFFSDVEEEEFFYRVKVDFTQTDENGKLKHSKTDYLVQGSSIESAKKNVDEILSDSMVEYRIMSVAETIIKDIIE